MKCVFASTIYKNEGFLYKSFDNIKKLQSLFNESKILVSYDNSGDNSLKELCELKRQGFDIDILIQQNERINAYVGRPYNIAQARNQLLKEIYTHYSHFDYFIMCDLDDIFNYNIHPEILQKYITQYPALSGRNDNWDSLCFWNEGFYDTWSVSHNEYQDSSWHHPSIKDKETAWKHQKDIVKHLEDLVVDMDINEEDITNIDSCFNGFAIHKVDKFKDIKYQPATILNDEVIIDCEHRSFYKKANELGLRVMFSKDCLFDKMNVIPELRSNNEN